MQIIVRGKSYYPRYIPFFRMKTGESAKSYKYGIRYPSGRIEIVFFEKGRNQVEQMKENLHESLLMYGLAPHKFMNDYERRMRDDVRDLFQIRD